MTSHMKDRPLVYIAGPYTNPDPVENTHNTLRKANELHETGLATCIVPHVSLFWHVVTPREYEHWLEYDIALLARCDALLRIPGESSGADKEVEFCHEHSIPVFYDEEHLLGWAWIQLAPEAADEGV